MLHSKFVFYSHIHMSPFNPKTCLSFWEIFLYYFFGYFLPSPSPIFFFLIYFSRTLQGKSTTNCEHETPMALHRRLISVPGCLGISWGTHFPGSSLPQPAGCCRQDDVVSSPHSCSSVLTTWWLASLSNSDPRDQGRSSNVFYDLPSKVTCCHSAV